MMLEIKEVKEQDLDFTPRPRVRIVSDNCKDGVIAAKILIICYLKMKLQTHLLCSSDSISIRT